MIQYTSRSTDRRRSYSRALRHLEALEPRTLLSAAPTSYTLSGVYAGFGAYDNQGTLWIYDNYTASLEPVKNGAVDYDAAIGLDFEPRALASGSGGVIYAADMSGFGAIEAINTRTAEVTKYNIQASDLPGGQGSSEAQPIALTVTGDGAVWFVGKGKFDSTNNTEENLIGRLDPTNGSNGSFTLLTTGASLNDSQASLISASGDSVWIGMGGLQVGGQPAGTNRVAAASWTGSAISLTAYTVAIPNSNAGANGLLNGLVAGSDGSVWFTLSNNSTDTGHATKARDQLVHGVLNGSTLAQTAYIDTATSADTPLNYGDLTLDANGNVWFVEFEGNQFGMLDSASGGFTRYDNPTADPFYLGVASADGTQISLLNSPNLETGDSSVIQIDVTTTTPVVTFSGTAFNINTREDTPLESNTLLATFTAAAPLTGYTATITWGDNTTSVVTPTLVPGSTDAYSIIVSGKAFATQGIYAGSVAVKDGTNTVGTLTFTSTISDTPLHVISVTASPLVLRIVTAVGTFTDDGDLALSTWKATINWGDNATSTGIIVRDPTQSGRYLVLALHQYRARGTYTVRLTVTTSEANVANTSSTLTTTVTAR